MVCDSKSWKGIMRLALPPFFGTLFGHDNYVHCGTLRLVGRLVENSLQVRSKDVLLMPHVCLQLGPSSVYKELHGQF